VAAPLSEDSRTKGDLTHEAFALLPYGLFAVIILAAVAAVQYCYPVAYIYFIHEDSVVENSTAIAFALAAVLLIWESWHPGHFLRRCLLIAVAAMAVFIAGEEISWGQRIFGIPTPEAARAVNIQGELNLHNLKRVYDLPKYKPLGAALLIGLAVSIALGPLQRRSDAAAIIRALPLLQPALAPLILLTAWILIFRPFVRSDELGELLFGLCLLAWASNLVLDGRANLHRLAPAVGVGALAAVVLLGGGLAAAFPPKHPGLRLNITAKTFAEYGLYEQSEQVFEYILAHPQYVQPNTQTDYKALLDRRTP
jgi:hypothetical protein